jgi:dipeptidyl aminopeptidase/acylaminoacyl peptidase
MARDGRHLLVTASRDGVDVRMLVPLGGGEPSTLTGGSRFSEEHPAISPDGRWAAFDSSESGQNEIYLQPVPDGPKRQVSLGGGQMPVWNRNGSELFDVARDGMLMSVTLRLGSGRPEVGEPQPLFLLGSAVTKRNLAHRHLFDASPDGQRFLVIRQAPDAEPDTAIVVTNWTTLLTGAR